MLYLIFVEAALEIVPRGLIGHPSVRRNAKRRGKKPEETLLNRSLHHSAMDRLPDSHKRGRPDIANICLLEALGSPLNHLGGLRIWLHTYDGYGVEIKPETRLPRDCNRFNSLIEQLFTDGRIPPRGEEALLTLTKTALENLVTQINPSHIVALTSHGEPSNLEELCVRLLREERPMIFIGAFPHGAMKPETLQIANEVLSIYPEPLEAWIVASRFIYEFEKALLKRGKV
ncbi:MAG: 16S rRNA methyltransferase [Candidatus Bathyarchaeota archaeon]|jgi:rRNA small subunit pseudouridine methyltransferase Nep1